MEKENSIAPGGRYILTGHNTEIMLSSVGSLTEQAEVLLLKKTSRILVVFQRWFAARVGNVGAAVDQSLR